MGELRLMYRGLRVWTFMKWTIPLIPIWSKQFGRIDFWVPNHVHTWIFFFFLDPGPGSYRNLSLASGGQTQRKSIIKNSQIYTSMMSRIEGRYCQQKVSEAISDIIRLEERKVFITNVFLYLDAKLLECHFYFFFTQQTVSWLVYHFEMVK